MLVSSSTQLSAADISLRENNNVTNGPEPSVVLGGGARPALGGCTEPGCTEPLATDPAAGTSAIAAATVTALSRRTRLLPACFLSRSPVILGDPLGSDFWLPGGYLEEIIRAKALGSEGWGVRS